MNFPDILIEITDLTDLTKLEDEEISIIFIELKTGFDILEYIEINSENYAKVLDFVSELRNRGLLDESEIAKFEQSLSLKKEPSEISTIAIFENSTKKLCIQSKKQYKRFYCQICQFSCSSKYILETHFLKVHSFTRYKCSKCGIISLRNAKCRSFQKNCANSTMEKIEIDPQKLEDKNFGEYKCKFCSMIYKNPNTRFQHVYAVHNGIKYKCEICSEIFSSKQNCVGHSLRVHGEPNFIKLTNAHFLMQNESDSV